LQEELNNQINVDDQPIPEHLPNQPNDAENEEILQLKSLKGLAFCSHFEHTRLQRKEESANMKMLRDDNERRSRLGFQLDTYGVDIDSLYNFLA